MVLVKILKTLLLLVSALLIILIVIQAKNASANSRAQAWASGAVLEKKARGTDKIILIVTTTCVALYIALTLLINYIQ